MTNRVLVVGTGSIGARHITNLLALGADVLAYSYRGRRVSESWYGHVQPFDDLDEAFLAAPDAIVVANRTDQHIDVALRAARAGRALFIEKPLSHSMLGVDDLAREVESRALIVESGFMLRFHPNLTWLKTFLDARELGSLHYCRASVGQYLPDWRPGQDYRASYSAGRACGGVIFDLVHELDLVRWLFGEIDEVQTLTAFASALEIESEAVAQIGLRTATGLLAQVHMDYLRPVYSRTLEVVGSRGVATWDDAAGTITVSSAGAASHVVHRVPAGYVRNDMFVAYLRHFLARLSDSSIAPASSLDDGIAALAAALACHRSAAERRVVRPRDMRVSTSGASV
jgi:predicted dehydrogenase